MEFWNEVPPANISLARIARAYGAKFGGKASSAPSTGRDVPPADPIALQAFLGQAEPVPYRAPAKGLPILH